MHLSTWFRDWSISHRCLLSISPFFNICATKNEDIASTHGGCLQLIFDRYCFVFHRYGGVNTCLITIIWVFWIVRKPFRNWVVYPIRILLKNYALWTVNEPVDYENKLAWKNAKKYWPGLNVLGWWQLLWNTLVNDFWPSLDSAISVLHEHERVQRWCPQCLLDGAFLCGTAYFVLLIAVPEWFDDRH